MPPADSNSQSFPRQSMRLQGATVDAGVPDLFQSCTRHKLDDLPVFLLSFQAYSCHLIAMIKLTPPTHTPRPRPFYRANIRWPDNHYFPPC